MTHHRNTVLAFLLLASASLPQAQTAAPESVNRGGFFIDVQIGNSFLRQGSNERLTAIGLGYRWQVGSVTLLGFEVGGGKDNDRFGSAGLTARLNFGSSSPTFARLRAGLWGDGSSGGPFFFGGLGVGIDLNRHISLNVTLSTYQHRGDALVAGLEARF